MPGPGPDLSHDEHFLIRNFRSLRGEQRRAVADIVGDLARAELARAEPHTRGQLCGPMTAALRAKGGHVHRSLEGEGG